MILCSGWAFRYFQLSDGGRQILRFLMPGDVFSPAAIFSERVSFSVKALTEVQVSRFGAAQVRQTCIANGALMMEAFRSLMQDGQAAYELVTALGRRPAEGRIAFLLLSLVRRIASRSIVLGQRYPFPLRQQHIGDAVGLTPVHVSRVLALLRDRNILAVTDGVLEIGNFAELERIGSL